MAINLTIPLTDEEQAEFQELGQTLYPSATGAELVAWAQHVAKNGLRSAVADLKLQVLRQQENQTRAVEKADFDAAWPVASNPLET